MSSKSSFSSVVAIAATLSILVVGVTSSASAQWVRTRGPYGGSVSSLVSDGATVYAGTGAGVFKSTDSGVSWSATAWLGLGLGNTWSLALDNRTLYAGTQDSGLYRSTNAGVTWNYLGLSGETVFSIVISTNTVTAATNRGISRTTNGGDLWLPCNRGLPENRRGLTLVSRDTTLIVGTDSGLFRMSLNDTSWTWINCGYSTLNIHQFAADSSGVWSATSGGVYHSTDEGKSWDILLSASPSRQFSSIFADHNVVYAGSTVNIFRSTDHGGTWTLVDSTVAQYANAFVSCGNTVICGGLSGMFRTSDSGLSWLDANTGIVAQSIYALGAEGSTIFANAENRFWISPDAGSTWYRPNTPNGIKTVSSFASIGAIFLAGSDNGILRSTDRGFTWNTSNVGLTDIGVTALLSTDSIVFAACGTTLFRSADSGVTWNQKSTVSGSYPINEIATLGRYVLVSSVTHLFRSSDDGQSWPDTERIMYSSGINRIISTGGRLFVAAAVGIYVSADSGTTWTRTDWGKDGGGSPGWEVFDLESKGTNLFAAAIDIMQDFGYDSAGIFQSSDLGGSWHRVDDGLPKFAVVRQLAVGKYDLFAGSSGVWRRPLGEMISGLSVKGLSAVPLGFTLRASPNPFFNRVSIEYDANLREGVELKVFNSLGVEKARLFSGTLEAGPHSFTWDASGVAPGLYECIVHTRDGVRSLPILLMQ
ncbi:MAG: hypothetical protein Q8922_12875 [Bacteroidota bacterium]|nr:hypothetical protein [Bacteroidota bacterium]MDP4234474.1 hypothetical protein [Bacteroidota bacterium]MDP4244178.1 hypothetical protein [Bacteroidota bacterium]MDP4288819.1 hypothetical protein [Bacteroidota bacterium]